MHTTIVAIGGGGFSMSETGESAIDDWLLERAGADSPNRPRVCFVPTASGDSREYCDRFEAAFAGRADTHVLSLFGQGPGATVTRPRCSTWASPTSAAAPQPTC